MPSVWRRSKRERGWVLRGLALRAPFRRRRVPALAARGRRRDSGQDQDDDHRDERAPAADASPLRVAEDAAVVDLISAGGSCLVSARATCSTIRDARLRAEVQASLFEEGIEVIRHALERKDSLQRQALELRRPAVRTRPKSKLPIYVGAFADPAIDRAARLADGFHLRGRRRFR